jgi:hypothetical protein
LTLVLSSYSQDELQAFVSLNSVQINYIHPDSTDFRDIESIGNAIGNSRIVMLGEQDHGDAPTFLAKTRLINYLHLKKGFTVIAFESDFYSATFGFENLAKTKQEYIKFYKFNLVPYWTLSDACNSLFTKTIPESFTSSNPITVAGFDNQMFYKYSATTLSKTIDSLSIKNNLEICNDKLIYKSILSCIDTLSNSFLCTTKSKEYYRQSIENLKRLQNDFYSKAGSQDISSIIISNLVSFANQLLTQNNFNEMVNMRDIQMAENLKWLCNIKFPTEKIIVWAANYHISKYMGHFKKKRLNNNISMATEFLKDSILNKQTYSLGFTSFDGEAGRIGTKTFTVDNPNKYGFETWINPIFNYAFTDFKRFNSLHPMYDKEFEMKSCVSDNSVHKSYPGQWNKIFDGIFFIRHMYPCKIKT